MNVISLGHACQVAHQLKRLGIAQRTHFFDWIVSHHDALIKNLHLNLDGVLFSEGVAFNGKRTHLRDVATGFWFYGHDFSGVHNRTGTVSDEELDEIKAKYLRRSHRTKLALSAERVTVIRHFFETPFRQAEAEQLEIIERLETLYPSTQFSYWWATELSTQGRTPPRGRFLFAPKSDDWKGDDHAWDVAAKLFS
ncbi:hypothetical protein I6F07_03610 [Ensifer sp. IC4062]|nr:hypothetical protein [Ensifer sp. IC4062]